MEILFGLLFFVAAVCFILGLIRPQVFSKIFKKKANRKYLAIVFGISGFVFLVIGIILSIGTPTLAAVKSPTNQKNITISGTRAFKDSEIKIMLNNQLVSELKADSKGAFSTQLELLEGENKIIASSTNNKSKTKTSAALKIILDLTPPTINLDTVPDKTDKQEVEITGTSEPDAEVLLMKGSSQVNKTRIKKEKFIFKKIKLDEGENRFQVTAADKAGNKSELKEIVVFYNKPLIEDAVVNTESEPQKESASSEPSIPALSFSEQASYLKDGQIWKMIVFSRKPNNDEIINAAKELHTKQGSTYFHLFDEGSKLEEYKNWDLHYGEVIDKDGVAKRFDVCVDISYCTSLVKAQKYAFPAPEEWMNAHELGMINEMGTENGPKWRLSTPLGEKISDL